MTMFTYLLEEFLEFVENSCDPHLSRAFITPVTKFIIMLLCYQLGLYGVKKLDALYVL